MGIILIGIQIFVLCFQSFVLGVFRKEYGSITTVNILGILVLLMNFYLIMGNIIRMGG